MKEKIKNKHAITLLALIITVIILLILATVSISLIINSGILDHAQQGVDKYSEEEELEQIKLTVASARLKGNGFLTTENLNSELQAIFGEDKEAKPIDNYWKFNGFKINSSGQIERTLPKEYQEVEYLQSIGAQYIDTEFIPNQDTKIDIDFVMNNYNAKAIYGSRIAFDSRTFSQMIMGDNNNSSFQYNNIAKTDVLSYVNGKRYNIVQDKNKVYVDGVLKHTFEYNSFNCPGNLYLCAVNQNRTIPFYGKISVYYFKVYDNNILVRNFIPCYSTTTVIDVDGIERPKDTIGLYDTVEGKFYVNQGTGTFLKGTDV